MIQSVIAKRHSLKICVETGRDLHAMNFSSSVGAVVNHEACKKPKETCKMHERIISQNKNFSLLQK